VVIYNISFDCQPRLIRIFRPYYKKLLIPKAEMPLVSIIIPAHNKFSYTYACIKSIVMHTTLSYEIIVADDFSQDETQNISRINIHNIT
jgi:cellulose synthase/poly-beta-1,6-N-acetylglucosamine synthase-like glycosyltransferase